MFEKMRRRRAEQLMHELDDTPVTQDTRRKRHALMEEIARNGVAINHNTDEYVDAAGVPLRPVTRRGTRRDR